MRRNIILTLTILLFISCKKESKFEYKYVDNDNLFKCSSVDMELIKEAVYAFEEYSKEYYSFQEPKSVQQGYYFYWIISTTNRLPAIEYVNPYIIKVRDALKDVKDLWITKNDETTLNINHPIINCISKQMINPEVKKLFNLLIDSNTFSSEVFLASMKRGDERVKGDKAFQTYLVLDTFYARILNVDFNNLEAIINKNRENAAKDKESKNSENIKETIIEKVE
ncbi:MAG: hypothetical protein DRI75_08855 [Bacteroidetes bacterium]|nr:MAG: hypothetical protein DRI75_08855 [Bacteroidota bacterium]